MTKEVADLACAYADVACGNVGVGADVFLKLGHKALAKAHNLSVRLALGIKVGAALTAAHRQTGQGVLKGLLKAEELDNALVYRRMETQTALVGTDRAIELNAETAVDLNLALVIYPRNAEFDNSFGFNHHINDAALDINGALLHNGLEGFENFANGLVELALAGVTRDNVSQNFLQIFILNAHNRVSSFLAFLQDGRRNAAIPVALKGRFLPNAHYYATIIIQTLQFVNGFFAKKQERKKLFTHQTPCSNGGRSRAWER